MLTRATLVAFDGASYTATIRPAASPARAVAGVAVARDIAAIEMVPGRNVAIASFTPNDPTDAVLVAVWT